MLPLSKLIANALVIVALLFSMACASVGNRVEGVEWKLVGWTLSSLDPRPTGITATFTDGQVSGFGGVNKYGGPCTTGPDGAFSTGPLRMTRMAGPEPAMRAEGAYTTLLGEARSWKVRGDTLTLYDAAGNESLSFTAVDSQRVKPTP